MTIAMPRVVQTPTHAYNPAPIVHDKVFVHMAEGGSAGGVAWLCSGNVQASTHLFMNEDGTVVYQLVPLGAKAWAECEFNGQGISMEIPGFTAKGIPDARWRAAALIVAWLCREYGIPPAWAKGGAGRGVCQHVDLGEAGGGHHDACGIGSQTWLTFMGYVKEAFDAFGPEALPPFALHGAPEPHTTELPPNAPPEPSHGGAARSASGEEPVLHPTPSGYAHGSVKTCNGGSSRRVIPSAMAESMGRPARIRAPRSRSFRPTTALQGRCGQRFQPRSTRQLAPPRDRPDPDGLRSCLPARLPRGALAIRRHGHCRLHDHGTADNRAMG